jgi:hypothetical protein
MRVSDSAPPAESEVTPVQVDPELERDFIVEFASGGELLMRLGSSTAAIATDWPSTPKSAHA